MQTTTPVKPEPASVNGVALHTLDDSLSADELRQRACSELLRQAAIIIGLLGAGDAPSADGVLSEEASGAIEALLEQQLVIPEPSEEACRRHHAAHLASYSSGERLLVRFVGKLVHLLARNAVVLGDALCGQPHR